MPSYKVKTVKSVDHLACVYNCEMLCSSEIYECLSPSNLEKDQKVMANVRITFKTMLLCQTKNGESERGVTVATHTWHRLLTNQNACIPALMMVFHDYS